MKRLTARVRGRVQGVSFRYNTRRAAKQLGLTGWVRNEVDSSVIVIAEGTEDDLKLFERFLEQGPPGATVRSVEKSWSGASGDFTDFEIRFT
jgi:acylphosphatase